MAKNVGILGTGEVAKQLALGFVGLGDRVMIAGRKADTITTWAAEHGCLAGSFAEAARFGDRVVLSVRGAAAEDVVRSVAGDLDGKLVMDTTNPIAGGPESGVLSYFTGPNESLMERLQGLAPKARFVKAFSCVGSGLMVHPKLPGGPPTMFVAGDDPGAKAEVAGVLKSFGWDIEDLGTAAAARAIEPLAILWCIPGFLQNRWSHALKMLKA